MEKEGWFMHSPALMKPNFQLQQFHQWLGLFHDPTISPHQFWQLHVNNKKQWRLPQKIMYQSIQPKKKPSIWVSQLKLIRCKHPLQSRATYLLTWRTNQQSTCRMAIDIATQALCHVGQAVPTTGPRKGHSQERAVRAVGARSPRPELDHEGLVGKPAVRPRI